MQTARLSALALSLSLFACGDDGGTKLVDSGIGNTDAAPKVCQQVTIGAGDINSETATRFISWFNSLNEMPFGGEAAIFTEFYRSVAPDFTGTIDFAVAPNDNYETCGACLYAGALDAGGTAVKYFYPQSGTITFTEDPITARRLNVTVSNLRLQEADIDFQTSVSTFLPTGDCLILNGTFAEDNVPNDWTCEPTAWYEADADPVCDCQCGVYDNDCRAPGVGDTTTGCTTAGMGACWQDLATETTCVARPANDTCATATTLTIGNAATGTTVGADRDYTTALGETQSTCAAGASTYPQAGPDVAYKVTLTGGTAYTVTLSGITAEFWDASLYVVGPDADNNASECEAQLTACVAGVDKDSKGTNETVTFTPATTGTYYIIVDGYFQNPVAPDPNDTPPVGVDVGSGFTITVTQ